MFWDASGSGNWETYTVTTADDQTGELYFTVETYYLGQISMLCQLFDAVPYAGWKLIQNGEIIAEKEYYEYFTAPVMVAEADYNAGDVFTIEVDYTWWGWYT